MNPTFCSVFPLLALAISALGADPLSLPSYRQEVVATFATPAQAAAAQMTVAALPNGAERAFATRWDDTSPAHRAKATMLESIGVKGNFYFVGRDVDLVKTAKADEFGVAGARELVRRGHTVGNHTLNHPFMLQLSTHEAYRQILLNRIALEKVMAHTVTSYASPFGWYGATVFDAANRRALVQALVETGHWVSGDNPLPDAQQPVSVWMPANRFSANDRNPDYGQFTKGLAQQEKVANLEMPRITLGTHSWCDAAGNALQAEWLKKHCVRPEWVQLNDYEYGAYRYSALYAAPAKKGAQAANATFALTRYEPTALGDVIPLSVSFSESPVSVTCGGQSLTKDAKGFWMLPHAANRRATLAQVAENEIGGVRLAVQADESAAQVVCTLVNGSTAALGKVSVVVLLPPGYAARRQVFTVPTVAAGASWSRKIALSSDVAGRPDLTWGGALYAVAADYETTTGRSRLWARTETAGVTPPVLTPNAVARSAGPFAESAQIEAEAAALSASTGPLPTTLGGMAVTWNAAQQKKAMWYNLTPCSVHRRDKGGFFVAAFQFKSESAAEVQLPCSLMGRGSVYLNGQKLAGKVPYKAAARAGVNRVVVAYTDSSSYTYCLQAAATTSRGLSEPLPCVPFE